MSIQWRDARNAPEGVYVRRQHEGWLRRRAGRWTFVGTSLPAAVDDSDRVCGPMPVDVPGEDGDE